MNARATRAGLNILYPVPPKISLPITTPNVVARATIHNGIVGGMTKGISIPVTRKPSFISCFRTTAKTISQKPPTKYETKIMGKTVGNPEMNISIMAAFGSTCLPTLKIPNNKAGSMAITTNDITRFKSTASRICGPFFVLSAGVNRNVSAIS